MVLNQIFAWASDIKWVPIKEWFSELFHFVGWDFTACVWFTQENEVPEIRSQILVSDSKYSWLGAIQISLKIVSNRIEGHINGTVWQRLNQIFRIERQLSTKPKWSRTSPLMQPVNGIDQIIIQNIWITSELFLYKIQHTLLPVLISIVNVPLFTEADNAGITGSRHYISVRLVVLYCKFFIDEVVFDEGFGIGYFLAFVFADDHFSFVKAFFVALLFG